MSSFTDPVQTSSNSAGTGTESSSTNATPYSSIQVGSSLSEVEETLARIKSHKGVEGVLVMNQEGIVIHSTLTEEQSAEHAALLSQLSQKACLVVNTLDPDDELTFLRLRSNMREIMIAPDNNYLLVVIQNLNA